MNHPISRKCMKMNAMRTPKMIHDDPQCCWQEIWWLQNSCERAETTKRLFLDNNPYDLRSSAEVFPAMCRPLVVWIVQAPKPMGPKELVFDSIPTMFDSMVSTRLAGHRLAVGFRRGWLQFPERLELFSKHLGCWSLRRSRAHVDTSPRFQIPVDQ